MFVTTKLLLCSTFTDHIIIIPQCRYVSQAQAIIDTGNPVAAAQELKSLGARVAAS